MSDRRQRYVAHAVRRGCSSGAVRLADKLDGFRVRGQPAHPGQVVLARWLNVCTRTVHRWTKELEAAGVLEVTRHAPHHDLHSGRWRRRTNAYRCRFRGGTQKSKPVPSRGNPQVTPSGHFCPLDVPKRSSTDRRPIPPAPPPVVTTWPECPVCGLPVEIEGKWRHPWCHPDRRRVPRPVEVP